MKEENHIEDMKYSKSALIKLNKIKPGSKRIHYRKKKVKGQRASYIIEGIQTKYNKKYKVLIKTLPDPITLIQQLDEKGSFFTHRKKAEMLEIIKGLDDQPNNSKNNASEVRTSEIIGTQEKDPFAPILKEDDQDYDGELDSELDELVERVE